MTERVLIAEKIGNTGIELIKAAGLEADLKTCLSEAELVDIIGDYAGLIVRSATTVTPAIIEAGKDSLKVIGRAGVGIDNVDVEAASEHNIIVCNAPFSNIVSAAEQTFALLLAVARNTAAASSSMKAGKWNRGDFAGVELFEKTLAIFGLGRIGGLIAQRAAAFDMRLIGYDPYCSPERAKEIGVKVYSDINEILPQADFITVHLPKTPETMGMFSSEQFGLMKDGVIVVNTARGGIYDLEALAQALESGKVRGAGIDVWENEPVTDSPLHHLSDNRLVTLTPHLGASTAEATERAGSQIAEYVIAGIKGEQVDTRVN